MGLLHRFPKCLLLVTLFSLYNGSVAQYKEERDALYALKHTFDDPFVNGNWTGLHCYKNTSFWDGIRCIKGRVTAVILESRGLSGTVPGEAFVSLSELITLSFKNNFLSGNIMDFSSNPKLKDIDLSKNMFDGSIPRSLLGLEFLQSLQLQDNQLTGPIPEFFQKSLTVFNVSNNKIICPRTNTLKTFSTASYSNNGPIVCDSSNSDVSSFSENQTASSGDSKTKFEEKDDEILEMGGVSYNYKESRGQSREENITHVHEDVSTFVANDERKGNLIFMGDDEAAFDLNDLLRASAEGLGKGLFGNSYKAKLEGRTTIVVKRLRDMKPLSDDEFAKLIRVIADQKHPNLLPLLAYYYTNDEKLFLYRIAKNGNLFNRLHGGRGTRDRVPLRWNLRLTIAQGVARAMEYLHLNANFSKCLVPHGNLKLANVLLDEDDTVLVSDYGLSSLIAVPIAAQRLVAYKSPEYQNSKRVSMKSDVWSFGCLLLELLTGRLSAHSAPPGINCVDLSSWIHRAVREEWTAEIFDTEISVQKNAAHGMLKLLQVAIRCCEKVPEKRPEMTEIVREIDSIKAVNSDESEELSVDQSLTDESFSANASTVLVVGDGRRR